VTSGDSDSLPPELFAHFDRLWEQIKTDFRDCEFTYDNLRSIGIWPEEASLLMSCLERWNRISTVGLRTFRVLSAAPVVEYCPRGVSLGGPIAAGGVSVSFDVHERYGNRLEEAARDFIRTTIPVFGSLLDVNREGGPVNLTVYPTSNVVLVIFATVPASLSEIMGFQRWAELKSADFGTLV
jgi:hypothetical protein